MESDGVCSREQCGWEKADLTAGGGLLLMPMLPCVSSILV